MGAGDQGAHMKLKWLDAGKPGGNCYAGINFRGIRMLTFAVTFVPPSMTDKTQKAKWVTTVGKEPISSHPTRFAGQAAAQKHLDDFIRGVFAAE
jgi:hypothetical protein